MSSDWLASEVATLQRYLYIRVITVFAYLLDYQPTAVISNLVMLTHLLIALLCARPDMKLFHKPMQTFGQDLLFADIK